MTWSTPVGGCGSLSSIDDQAPIFAFRGRLPEGLKFFRLSADSLEMGIELVGRIVRGVVVVVAPLFLGAGAVVLLLHSGGWLFSGRDSRATSPSGPVVALTTSSGSRPRRPVAAGRAVKPAVVPVAAHVGRPMAPRPQARAAARVAKVTAPSKKTTSTSLAAATTSSTATLAMTTQSVAGKQRVTASTTPQTRKHTEHAAKTKVLRHAKPASPKGKARGDMVHAARLAKLQHPLDRNAPQGQPPQQHLAPGGPPSNGAHSDSSPASKSQASGKHS